MGAGPEDLMCGRWCCLFRGGGCCAWSTRGARCSPPSNSMGVPSPAPDSLRGRGTIMRVGLPLKVGGGETPCGPAAGRPGYSAAPGALGPNTLRQGFPEPRTHWSCCQGGASSADGLHGLSQKAVPTGAVICDAARKGQSCEGQGSGPGL